MHHQTEGRSALGPSKYTYPSAVLLCERRSLRQGAKLFHCERGDKEVCIRRTAPSFACSYSHSRGVLKPMGWGLC